MRCGTVIAAQTANLCMRFGPLAFIAGPPALPGNHGVNKWNFIPCRRRRSRKAFVPAGVVSHERFACATLVRPPSRKYAAPLKHGSMRTAGQPQTQVKTKRV